MSNDWFQFKQFRVEQSHCAMKVSTDACVQGAWAASQLLLKYAGNDNLKMLDIGCGSGLLSLLLAQNFSDCLIDAIDIDLNSYEQASQNFIKSGWSNRLQAHHSELQAYNSVCLYDVIICNPPFFHKSLKNNAPEKTIARHDDLLTKEDLANNVLRLLQADGLFCVMYPVDEWEHWNRTAIQKGMYAVSILNLYAHADRSAKRKIGIYTKKMHEIVEKNLIVYDEQNQYTTAFQQLLQPYYLNL